MTKPNESEPERPTEDDIALEKLGGVKGAPDLPPAPLVPQQEKNIPRHIDNGHTA